MAGTRVSADANVPSLAELPLAGKSAMVTSSFAHPSLQEMRRTVLPARYAVLSIACQPCKPLNQYRTGIKGVVQTRAYDIDAPSPIQAHSSPPVATPGSSGIPHVS